MRICLSNSALLANYDLSITEEVSKIEGIAPSGAILGAASNSFVEVASERSHRHG